MNLKFDITKIFFIWILSIFIIFYLGYSLVPHGPMSSQTFFESLSNWDGKHFLKIAETGYFKDNNTAFFPLYPLSIKILTFFTRSYLLSAILISSISFYLSLRFLYELVRKKFSQKIAQETIFALLLFPTSFFFITAYSESLFFLFVVLTFYFKEKNNIKLTTFFAILASLTRLAGIALVLALILDVLISRVNRKNWIVFLSPTGLILYMSYLYWLTGSAFYLVNVEQSWGRVLTPPWTSFWFSLVRIIYLPRILGNLSIIVDLLFAIFGLGLALRSFRFLPKFYSLYSLISVIIPIITGILLSFPRFLLPIFPLFILIALIKNNYIKFFYFVISFLLLVIFSILFINGYWVS